jgi:hypothetical protein
MIRLLVRIVSTDWNSYEHLVGSLAYAYAPEGRPLSSFLRLEKPDPLVGMSSYVVRENFEFDVIRSVTFGDWDP